MARIDGVDVSHYQMSIDWSAVPESVQWTACKATEGVTYVDPTFEINRRGMVGRTWRLYYHWITPTVSWVAQARHFLSVVGELEPGEGLMLDAEEEGITAAACAAFCDLIEATTGRPVAVYSGVHVAGGSLWKSSLLFNDRRPRVLAAYIDEAKARAAAAPFGWDVWQWDSKQTVPGIPTRVDVNQVDRIDRMNACCGITQPPAPPEDDMDKIAFIGITGEATQGIWKMGKPPIVFTNPADRDAILKGLGIDPADGVEISAEMFARLA